MGSLEGFVDRVWSLWLNTEIIAKGMVFFSVVGDPGVDVDKVRYERWNQTLQERRVSIQDELIGQASLVELMNHCGRIDRD